MNQEHKRPTIKEAFLHGLTFFLVLVGAIFFSFCLFKIKEIIGLLKSFFSMLTPIILGIVIAYLIHPVVAFFEIKMNLLWTKVTKRKLKEEHSMMLPAILLTLLLVFFAIYMLMVMVIPELYSSIIRVVYTLPHRMTVFYNDIMSMTQGDSWLSEIISKAYDNIMDFVTDWLGGDMLTRLSVIINGVFGVVGVVSNLLIGVIVAIYVLLEKDKFKRQFNMILHAFFSDEVSAAIKDILRKSDHIFGGFISGKIIDSLIIGVLFFIGASILKLPYAVLVSVIVGVTNIIPFFGPYIGAIPSAILIMLYSPAKGLVFIVFIIILQQFDGNILGPKILGNSTGLSPFWVIFSIMVGSGMFGFIGMIIGVPLFGVIYYLVKRYVHYRLQLKNTQVSVEDEG